MNSEKVWVGNTVYDVYRYFVPAAFGKRLRFIKKWFKVMDRDFVSDAQRRRKSHVEYAEVAIMMLGRVETFLSVGRPLAVGSCHLSHVPWAIFGEAGECFAKLMVLTFGDLCDHYQSLFSISESASNHPFHFRSCPKLAFQLGAKYNKSAHYIMAVAIGLLSDLLVNCGPDCEDFYDLYTNDYQVTADFIEVDEWEALRCKVMGRYGKIQSKRFVFEVGQIKPNVPMVSIATFEEIVCDHENLAVGEKTKSGYWNPVIIQGDDDGGCSSYECLPHMRDRAKKHPKLFPPESYSSMAVTPDMM